MSASAVQSMGPRFESLPSSSLFIWVLSSHGVHNGPITIVRADGLDQRPPSDASPFLIEVDCLGAAFGGLGFNA